jgi:hypothetical protein
MKKILLSIILVFSIVVTNAQLKYYNNNCYQTPYIINRPQNNILPSIITAVATGVIINHAIGNQYDYRDDSYRNQLEIERLNILQKKLEIKAMRRQYRKEHGFRLFRKNH